MVQQLYDAECLIHALDIVWTRLIYVNILLLQCWVLDILSTLVATKLSILCYMCVTVHLATPSGTA